MRVCANCETQYGDERQTCPLCGSTAIVEPKPIERETSGASVASAVRYGRGMSSAGGTAPGDIPDGGSPYGSGTLRGSAAPSYRPDSPGTTVYGDYSAAGGYAYPMPVKKKSKAPIVVIVLLLVLIVAAVSGFAFWWFNSTAAVGEDVVNEYLVAVKEQDISTGKILFPPDFKTQYTNANGVSGYDAFVREQISFLDSYKKWSATIVSSKVVTDSSSINDFETTLQSRGYYTFIDGLIEVQVKISETGGSGKTQTIAKKVIQVNGQWYLSPYDS